MFSVVNHQVGTTSCNIPEDSGHENVPKTVSERHGQSEKVDMGRAEWR